MNACMCMEHCDELVYHRGFFMKINPCKKVWCVTYNFPQLDEGGIEEDVRFVGQRSGRVVRPLSSGKKL